MFAAHCHGEFVCKHAVTFSVSVFTVYNPSDAEDSNLTELDTILRYHSA